MGADAAVPVFLYGDLATRLEHAERAWIRRGGPAELALSQLPALTPMAAGKGRKSTNSFYGDLCHKRRTDSHTGRLALDLNPADHTAPSATTRPIARLNELNNLAGSYTPTSARRVAVHPPQPIVTRRLASSQGLAVEAGR